MMEIKFMPYLDCERKLRYKPNEPPDNQYWETTGFKMIYSFLGHRNVPQRFSNGKWNCSDDYWDDLQYHLECNFKVQCQDSRDEAKCSYSSPPCPPATIRADDLCLFISKPVTGMKTRMSWFDSSGMCKMENGRVAALNTRKRYFAFVNVMQRTDSFGTYFVGLRTTTQDFPPW